MTFPSLVGTFKKRYKSSVKHFGYFWKLFFFEHIDTSTILIIILKQLPPFFTIMHYFTVFEVQRKTSQNPYGYSPFKFQEKSLEIQPKTLS